MERWIIIHKFLLKQQNKMFKSIEYILNSLNQWITLFRFHWLNKSYIFHCNVKNTTKYKRITLTSCNTECCGGTLSCSNAVGGETCVSSYITGCSIEDGQRWSGGGTTTVFVGVGIGSDGCYGTTNISLPLYIIYL